MKEITENKIARREYVVLGTLLLLLLGGVVWSGLIARKERRDGQRKDELRQIKTALEMYYNKHNEYPLTYDSDKYQYVVVNKDQGKAVGWYISGQLERKPRPTAGFDYEYNVDWRVTKDGQYQLCGGDYSCLE